MAHSFIAYIDESGDDGLGNYRAIGRQGGASHWLAINGSVWRYSRDLESVQWAREIKQKLPAQRRDKPLHFVSLDHAQRVMAVQHIAERPIRSVCVIANKPSIPAGTYTQKNQLYFYMCRYLIERLSWLCRDLRPQVQEGDGRLKIVFARRGGMSYSEFQNYMHRLKNVDDPERVQINWAVIDIDGIEARDHSTRAGLQISDIVASGITAALEPNLYGNCEMRFAQMLKPQMYNKRGNYLSYGTKIVPSIDKLQLNVQQQQFIELFGG